MKLSDVRKKLWPNEVANEEKEATPAEVAELAGRKAAEFAKEKIDEAQRFSRFAHERAELAESSAKAQIASLQKMYVEMLTECHQEIAELKGRLAAKTANAKSEPTARLFAQVGSTDGLGTAVPPAPTFEGENGGT